MPPTLNAPLWTQHRGRVSLDRIEGVYAPLTHLLDEGLHVFGTSKERKT